MNPKRVVVAMSGGVDSSVAAALLKEQGYDVVGVTMNLYSLPKVYCRSENLKSCCGWKATEDAHQVALSLGISHYVVDFRRSFEKSVITDFCEEYAQGRTPNPCIRCNQYIKFDVLLKKMKALEADYLATGHHARIEYDKQTTRYILKKGKDREKDQSYFLYPLTQKQLSRTLMPIGDLTKEEVRKKAQASGLPVAERPESQEICFVPDNDYAGFLQTRIPEAFLPGPVVDSENRTLAQHKGIIHYTIGQRRGMGISAPHPLYVLSILSEKNTIVVGPEKKLYEKLLLASKLNMVSLEKITEPLKVKARIRYKHREAEALVSPMDSDKVRVEFKRSQRAITPGQSVVFYDGDMVIGGGIIDKSGV
ncbi:MAG: tRNA 2-thiouridine(34) synthase MnmA [Candidatus Aminicenantes bacterium]|jgi:tRNA-specific 2-thiouridylase